MGDLRPGNGGGTPPDDGAYPDLPDLPPEWGTIIIPDDPAELAAEADEVRRELRRQAWRNRLRALVGLGPRRRGDPSLGVPLVIMSVAVVTTLLSLFVVTWDHNRATTTPVGPDAALQETAVPLPAVTLTDAAGSRVRLGDVLPALLLMVEGCDCGELIADIAAAAPKLVTVVPVSEQAACAVGTEKNVRCLADPAGVVTGRFPAPADVAPTPTVDPSPPPSPDATAGEVSPTPSASALPPPTAVAVPVDGNGVAHEPIVVTSVRDVSAALAALATSD
ncbi:MAG: hypothetical protein IRY85_00825 [Micromonosporaceae bacterium]|nr:hypothetical protein [Micromonosporaceae bacterium]